jgi:hypothetical protein
VCERREKVENTPDRDRGLGALLGHIERHGLDGNADIHEENNKSTDELQFLTMDDERLSGEHESKSVVKKKRQCN